MLISEPQVFFVLYLFQKARDTGEAGVLERVNGDHWLCLIGFKNAWEQSVLESELVVGRLVVFIILFRELLQSDLLA